MPEFTDLELQAYLDEAIAAEEMARIEAAARDNKAILRRLSEINRRRDMGVHTLGEVWRRHRLSCPKRQQLGAYLLDALDTETANYIYFHLTEIGCRFCLANLEDLQAQKKADAAAAKKRRRRYFQSSAGYLKKQR
jgi:hypothetical protein